METLDAHGGLIAPLGLHAGLLRVSGCAPDGLCFELGLRPGAAPLARYRSGDIGVPDLPMV